MNVYLDSSAVLRPLLDQPDGLKCWGQWETAYSSELLGVECRRAIDRLRLLGLYDDKQVAEPEHHSVCIRESGTRSLLRLQVRLTDCATHTFEHDSHVPGLRSDVLAHGFKSCLGHRPF